MRRAISKPYTIQKIFPVFFWHKCDLCHEEFKKEIAWKINFRTTSRIICIECASNEKAADEFALTWGTTGCDKPSVRLKKLEKALKRS